MADPGGDAQGEPIRRTAGARGTALTSTTRTMTKEEIKALAVEINLQNKQVLTSKEAALYLGLSLSYLYKLTYTHRIPFYCPGGKCNYYNREELYAWALSNRVSTTDEVKDQAAAYCQSHK